MCISFAEHVRTYGRDCDPNACILPRIEKLLKQRMRRRNLLSAPPAYLGYDLPSWEATDAFEDIAEDCYLFAVAKRIEGLQKQLRVQLNIDGLITRNVDNFLMERQRRRDPIGYAVFGNVEAAAAELAASGQLVVDGLEDGRLKSNSLLKLDTQRPGIPPIDPEVLHTAVADADGWSEALADLIWTTEQGNAWIAGFLQGLCERGIACVRVTDLVSAIASRARTDWAIRHSLAAGGLAFEGDGDLGALVRLVQPDDSVEVNDRLEMLRRLVPERIAELRQERVRSGLTRVFQEWLKMIEENGFSKPNQAELAERLGMSDATVSDYLKRLREILATILPPNPEN